MTTESLAQKIRRKRFEEKSLNSDELREWYQDHPEDVPEGQTDNSLIASDPDLVPSVELSDWEPDELQPYLDGVDILDAYARWCGKMVPDPGSRREGIKISCPNPLHPDADPSAWVNLDEQVWFCGGCQEGGDKYDIAAWNFGYAVPAYKHDGSFPQLRAKMAEDLGYIVRKSPGGKLEVVEPTVEPEPEPDSAPAEIVPIPTEIMDEPETIEDFSDDDIFIDWEDIVPPETFLWEWMHATTIDDLPHEFYFWMGMQALSACAGTDVILHDYKPIKGNLFICTYGRSGSGKTRAKAPLDTILKAVLPFKDDPGMEPTGIKILPSPGSSEALLYTFQHEVLDPSTMKPTGLAQIRGLLTIEEFAAFVARSARTGSSMKETLIELFDTYDTDVVHYSRSGGHIRARNPYCLMVTTTQPKAIHAFMRRSDVHSGFMNRFIFAAGKRRRERIAHGGVTIDLTDSKNFLERVHSWCLKSHQMELTGDALAAWEKFYFAEISPLFDVSDETMFSRIDLTLKKLILLFTVNEKLDNPTAEIVERVVKLFPYLKATYSLFSEDIALDEVQECKNAVIRTIKAFEEKNRRGPTRREVVMRLVAKHGIDNLTKTMAFLEVNDVVEIRQEGGVRGPKTKRYYVGD